MRTVYSIFTIPIMLLVFLCTSPTDVSNSGGGTKTGNPAVITGMVINRNGTTVAGAQIIVHQFNYLHKVSLAFNKYNTTTDDKGTFRISIVDTGNFDIEVTDHLSNTILLKCAVNNEDSSINLGIQEILPFAAIEGTFHGAFPGNSYYAHVYGLERTVLVDSFGKFQFSDLPAGTFTVCITEKSNKNNVITYNSIYVNHGDTVVIPYTNLKYSQKIYFNTTSSGAAVSSDLYNIPVLLRLNSTNIDFSQTNMSGSDLRFRKVNGSPIIHEIDHWDTNSQAAAIWLSIDTLYKKSNMQYILMHWGSSDTEDSSRSKSVLFDSINGFRGVWHLGNNVEDASSYKHPTTTFGTFEIPGLIGMAQKFSGNEYIKIDGLLDKPMAVTLSAWVNLEQVGTIGSEIVSIGDAVLIRMDDSLGRSGGVLGAYHIDTSSITGNRHFETSSNQYLQNTGWHFICYTIDSDLNRQKLFIDGELAVATDSKHPLVYDKVGENTFIGMHGDSATAWNFNGIIDEVQISDVCRSAEWIWFSYVNQKGTTSFMRFEP